MSVDDHKFGDVTPTQIPANQRLWDMLVTQAKHRFNTYPSLAASHWIHEQYIKEGGQFVKSKKEIKPEFRRESEQKDKQRELTPEEKKRVVKALKHKRRSA